MWRFQEDNSFDQRKSESEKLGKSWPDKVPIVLEKHSSSYLKNIPRVKFLCPMDYTFSQLLSCLRIKLKIKSQDALFIFVNQKDLVTGDKPMLELFHFYKEPDGFLYLMYCEHETLG